MLAAVSSWLSLPGLVLVAATNSAPVVASWLAGPRAAWPIDGGVVLPDGQRLLGAHKTWRGLAAAAGAGAALAPWLGVTAWHGAAAGVVAIVGDALSSFAKRRLRLRPGAWIPGLDQCLEAALPLWVVWAPLALDLRQLLVTIAVFSVLDLAASRTLGSSRRERPPRAEEPGPHAPPGDGASGGTLASASAERMPASCQLVANGPSEADASAPAADSLREQRWHPQS